MKQKNIALELRKIANLTKRAFDKELKNKITNTQSLILNFIYDSNQLKKIVYQKDIEDFFEIRRSTVCEILNIMEKNNLIKRIASQNDLRQKEIILEENGLVYIHELKENVEKLEQIMEKNILESEIDIFCLVLEKIRKNLEDLC